MSIFKKLLAIQSENITVAKDATNPHFKSKYMDLDTIIEVYTPVLTAHSIVAFHHTESGILKTTLHDTESDTSITSEFSILNSDPQKRGAEITYGRRYNLCQLLNITAEDDDGNTASGENFKAKSDTRSDEDDNKPWFNQANLEGLSKVIANYSSSDEAVKKAREKYKVSKKSADAINHLYETGELLKI